MKNFEQVNKELNLTDTPDWGIINADEDRVVEFIEFIEFTLRNEALEKKVKFELLELVIASVNEALLTDKLTKDQLTAFEEYLAPYVGDTEFLPIIPYWKSIGNNSEFPVGLLLNEIVN